jgi:NAD(P)-dependent dehydrogenase (short-subunit alcohol dehydrogenase family)
MAMKHVAIAGATDGIGLAVALEYARQGWRVALLGRDQAKLDGALEAARAVSSGEPPVGIVWEATRAADAKRALDDALRALGQLDLLIYNAGLMLWGQDAEARGDAAALMMDVNVVGAIRMLEHAADYMAAAGRGRIAVVGSIAGDRGRKGNPAYGASKAAIEQYCEGLRSRLHPSGVGVSLIKPGYVRTKLLRSDIPSFPPAVAPEVAARRIVRKLGRGAEVFYVPGWWAPVGLAMRLMPRFLFKRIAPA